MFNPLTFNLEKYFALLLLTSLLSCRSGLNLFKPVSPHQAYRQKLINAGLDKTALGASWISKADSSLQHALSISIPYKESGYFAAERIPVSSYQFTASRGQKLRVSLSKKPVDQFRIYVDIWERPEDGNDQLLASADTTGKPLELEIKANGTYLMRLQPELLQSGQYTIEITSGPSLGFPVKSSGRPAVQSYFGEGRDANTRKHEGIDIFAPFRTPVVAVAEGLVLRVNENNLGGKVVWMRPSGKDYTLYYAHLDEQLAIEGQQVFAGDTLGLMGNTGNAKTTPPHLHLGIYTAEGAVDPFPFVNPVTRPTPVLSAGLALINATARSVGKAALYSSPESTSAALTDLEPGTIMHVNAANSSWYSVQLPDGLTGFIQNKKVTPAASPLRKLKVIVPPKPVYDQPDSLAAIKLRLPPGKTVDILGSFGNYYLIADSDKERGWISQK